MGSLKVCRRDSSESFLAGCVPDLELGRLAVHSERLHLKVDADSWHEVFGKLIV